ncbi:hypothetical protein G6514_006984 [Epicoccum nigrum]|nr:hypothetical protein G6514_006984 [Epicoccum nigrum]
MVFIVMTMLFTLIFPTLGGSMTGYSANVNAYVRDADENFIQFKDFEIVVYTVHDGSRINQTDDFHATIYKNKADDPNLLDLIDWYDRPYFTTSCSDYSGEQYLRCTSSQMLWNISAYITSYGPYPQTDVASEFGNGISLTGRTLNISSYQWPLSLNGTKGGDGRVYQQDAAVFLSGNTLYSQSDVMNSAQCQAQESYQWGFSFIQLAVMLILLWIWTIGIVIMYTTSKFTRLQRGRPDVAGEYKAVFELADAMHTQLIQLTKEEGTSDDVRSITESTLRQRIKSDLRGGTIAYDTNILLDKADQPGDANNWTFKAWAMREMWWLLALAVAVAVDGVAISLLVRNNMTSNVWIFPALPLAIGFAMFVGSTHASRVMVLTWAVLLVCAPPAIALGAVMSKY